MDDQVRGGSVPPQGVSAQGVAAAVRSVPGVAGARVVRRRGGPDEVRLSTRAGHDPEEVAGAVRTALARASEPSAGAGAPGVAAPVGAREVAGAPDVLDLTDHPAPAPPPARVVVEVAPEPTSRLELQRLRVGTEALGAVAEVVLADGDVLHVGSAETAATADGTRRALATATAQALESAAAGELRIQVDGVQVEPVAGRATVVVALSVVSSRGAEHLAGCALADDDPGRAVVAAVLDAANRRIELAMAERAAQR